MLSGANQNLLQDMYEYRPEKDAYRTAFKFADTNGMGFLTFAGARAALTTAGIHADAARVHSLWEVMAKVPDAAQMATIDPDTFVWLAEALSSSNPDIVVRPVKLPKVTRAGRLRSLAKSVKPMAQLARRTASGGSKENAGRDKTVSPEQKGNLVSLPPIGRETR